MGAGDDVFQWDPGDGSDVVEGQDGTDSMVFNGAAITEKIDISANGTRVRFTRDIGTIVMDLAGTEKITFTARAGADTVTVGDMTGTDLKRVDLDLAGTSGSGVADGEADSVIVSGTQANDQITINGGASGVSVNGLQTVVNITGSVAAQDQLTVNGQAGIDTINASGLAAGAIDLIINGGLGDDALTGSQGNDLINGGDGNDVAQMGAGDDTFVWNPGDDNDIIEGQAGFDTMQFNGAAIAEKIDISANGTRVRFTRDIASVVMDLNDVDGIDFTARGGVDQITVNDLSGTDVTEINLNLELTPGSGAGDGAADNVIVNGTNDNDVIVVSGDATGTSVLGLAAQINITGAEAANDRLIIQAQDGDDAVDASGLVVGAIQLSADGGNGDDVLIGGAGNDNLAGSAGDDILVGGPGQDVLDGGDGDNTVIQ